MPPELFIMPLVLTAAHHSQTGLREHNEDVVGMVMPAEPALSAKGMIAAIADGVSGSAGGRAAAEHAVRTLLTDYPVTPDDWPVRQALDSVITAINLGLQQQSGMRGAAGDMATTLTALVVSGIVYHYAHVGDTRLYLLRHGALVQLTSDHVSGHPQMRHLLTRAIGLDRQLDIEHGTGELQAGDIFLLVSDGVWNALPEHELSWHLSTLAERPDQPEATAKLLVDAALAAGSQDNASAIVIHITQLPEESLHKLPYEPQPLPAQPQQIAQPTDERDPLAIWKVIGAISLLANLLLLYLLVAG